MKFIVPILDASKKPPPSICALCAEDPRFCPTS